MLEEIAISFKNQDYSTAAKLIKQLLKESPENLWGRFYLGKLYEVSSKQEKAEEVYRQLLRLTTNTKILNQARQGLKRLEEIKEAARKQAIIQAIAAPNDNELGILVLEPINNEIKTKLIPKFAQIMQLDPYSARLILPSRGWRVYRTGKIGELQFYGTQLQQAGIPCFWLKIAQVQQIKVFQVEYFIESQSKVTVFCRNELDQLGAFSFDLSEVTAKVMGMLPIFEQVVDVNHRRQIIRKTKTQDYAQFCDLLLPKIQTILRIYDHGYDFNQGLELFSQSTQNTMRINWNNLVKWLENELPQAKSWTGFTPFAETVLDQTEMLNQIPSHVNLFRREQTNWDAAFQLYSGIILNLELRGYTN
ncbi:tetratricopeptide repeat protein [Cronbergia sp. UHCC 0137]|uniref:tetratricopeptide repeat protein n=1 Tax=Cronbergia sp. UHCC 0137 TaxID=3110239 RepID=UPI002B2003BA|nr:tetratricopeptide repeat protein [Cronbergia sp. UHCC 0137]MEA5619645.1 tetratricopeptide repeat protein [Cronbergia sp. UHCC 0137]